MKIYFSSDNRITFREHMQLKDLMNGKDILISNQIPIGKISRFNGQKTGKKYYTEFAKKVPKDCVILILACGKYRRNMYQYSETRRTR